MYFVDTNVFLYAAGSPSRYQAPCQLILAGIFERLVPAVTSTEVLQEILHYYIAMHRKSGGIEIVENILPWMRVLSIDREDLEQALKLHRHYGTLSSRDAIHVATMIHHGIREILTVDKDFDSLKGIKRVDIFELIQSWTEEIK